jgi:hypothetical protein
LIDVDEDIIQHYPPKYLVGPTTGEENVILEQEFDLVRVKLVELEASYLYSNPTGLFNASLPNKIYRPFNVYQSLVYRNWKT